MLRTLSVRLVAIAAVATAIGAMTAATSGAGTRPPSVRLLSVVKHVDVQRYGDQPDLYVQGVNVASVDGAFEVDAVAGPNGTATLWQVNRDSSGVHRIRQLLPRTKVDMSTGLPNFFHAVLRDAAGKPALDTMLPFCPAGGYGAYGGGNGSRTDTSGPILPSYPAMCGTALTKKGVWGLDKGWAVDPGLDLLPDNMVPDGEYTLDLTIPSTWTSQLDIPAKSAAVHLALTVTTQPDCTPEQPCTPSPAATRSAASHRAEGPQHVSPAESFGNNGLTVSADGTPDMGAVPAYNLATENNADDHKDYLDFDATVTNLGSGPLVVEGFRQGDKPVMTAKQFIYRNGQPVRSATVGQFEFDTRPGHNHWHMEDIAQYDLLDASGKQVVVSEKQSFCLAPTDPIDLTLKGVDWQPDRTALWSACAGDASIWLREVLPAGWGDTYSQTVAGQSFDLSGLPNGRYQVRVTSDPNHKLLETNYSNNSAVQPIELSGTPGHRTVTLVK